MQHVATSIGALIVLTAIVATPANARFDLPAIERQRILAAADVLLFEDPVTVTAATCPRSAGGPHDFYSEGDYWWPDPNNPEGPYLRRDGESNPANFSAHRHAMVRFSLHVATLTAARQGEWRHAIRRACPPASRGLVPRSRHAHEPEPARCPGHQGTRYRAGHRHHRYHPAR